MAQMNFDLEDGLPPISFSLKTDDAKRFIDFMADCNAAVKLGNDLLDALKISRAQWIHSEHKEKMLSVIERSEAVFSRLR